MRQSLLADCAARSRSLAALVDTTEETPLPADAAPDDLVTDWREVFDSEAAFRDRLGFAGLTPETVRERLDSPSDADVTIPPAVETAERVVDRAVERGSESAEYDAESVEYDAEAVESLVARHPDSPFVHLVAPLAVAVSDRVSPDADLAPTARESLDDWLFDRLTAAFRHPLFIQFKAHQQVEYPDTDFEEQTDSTEVYDEFVAAIRDADYDPVFEMYPVLLELLGVVADQWVRLVRRLSDRISADRDALSRTFADGDDLGRVADLTALSDDPHGDGEIVWGVHFEADHSVVYKPRSVADEAAFGDLLDWVNDRVSAPDLAAPTVLDRDEYGWAEFVSHQHCDSSAAVERYYERMGVLTGLAFLVGSTDFHRENVVASGDQPIVVDLETLLSPGFDDPSGPSSPAVSSLMENTVLETVLVPFTSDLNDDGVEPFTDNGLSELDSVEVERESVTFVRPNTDAMDLLFRSEEHLDGTNLPRLDGEIAPVESHLPALKRGFSEVTATVCDHRDELLAADGPLQAFEGCEFRYLLRPTRHYGSELVECTYSSQLRSGLQRSLALESLYETFVPEREGDGGDDDSDGGGGSGDGDGSGDDLWKLVAAEKSALRRFTVPRFTVSATGRELRDARGEPQGAFADRSPLARARQRIADLDQHRIDTQLHVLDLAFDGPSVPDPVSAPPADRGTWVPDADDPAAVASNVAAALGEATTAHPDGGQRWAELVGSPGSDPVRVHESKLNLYEGSAGVGVFLAAAAVVLGDDELADQSRCILNPVRSAVENDELDRLGIGGTTGKGSVAYGLVTAGDLLGDDDLVALGRTVAGRTTPEEVAADDDFDVMGGVAGELLAQLAVHHRTGDDAALDRVRWCADRLLDAAAETDAGYRVPTTRGEETGDHQFGFAHGVGGVGTALVRFGEVTGDDEYARVGRNALRFDAELWREGDPNAGSETIWGWCKGAAGVGFGRMELSEAVRDESLGVDLRDSLRTALSVDDSVCCGSTGRALFMLEAGEALGDPDLVSQGEILFADALDRARREGRLRLGVHLPELPNLGLFTGLAGVGYVALRLAARETDTDLPNVTRLE